VTASLILLNVSVFLIQVYLEISPAPWRGEILVHVAGLVPGGAWERAGRDTAMIELYDRARDQVNDRYAHSFFLTRSQARNRNAELRQIEKDFEWAVRFAPYLGFLTLVASLFLHGGLAHLLGNMWFLWIFGDNIEDRLGRGRFLLFYLFCGIAAGVTHVASDSASLIPTIGASGAIGGILGAYVVLFPHARVLSLFFIFFVELPAWVFLGIWFFLQWIGAREALFFQEDRTMGGVAYWAHIGGFLAGFLLIRLFLRDARRANADPFG